MLYYIILYYIIFLDLSYNIFFKKKLRKKKVTFVNETKVKVKGERVFGNFFQPGKLSIAIDIENFDLLFQLIKPLEEWEIAVFPEQL